MTYSYLFSIKALAHATAAVFMGVALVATSMEGSGSVFRDPLSTAAPKADNLERRPFQAVTEAGEARVAVGARGLIAYSVDQGKTWLQAASPVQSDLLAVQFVDAEHGWAVGHDGVVLRSRDGGRVWHKQFDGIAALEVFSAYYDARGEDPMSVAALDSVNANYARGPSLPLLDVWFTDRLHGYAVGSFGILIQTADGGQTWEPLFHQIDNPDALNLNAIRTVGGRIYVAAERGTLFRLDPDSHQFQRLETGNDGSWFGVTGDHGVLLAYGLNGSLYRSLDQGDSWTRVPAPTRATFTAGMPLADGRFALSTVAGDLLVLAANSGAIVRLAPAKHLRITGLAETADGRLLLSSLEGLQMHVSAKSVTSIEQGAH